MGKARAEAALRGLENFYVRADVMRAGDENGIGAARGADSARLTFQCRGL